MFTELLDEGIKTDKEQQYRKHLQKSHLWEWTLVICAMIIMIGGLLGGMMAFWELQRIIGRSWGRQQQYVILSLLLSLCFGEITLVQYIKLAIQTLRTSQRVDIDIQDLLALKIRKTEAFARFLWSFIIFLVLVFILIIIEL